MWSRPYKKDSEWHYFEVELARRHVMEPIGGYGFNKKNTLQQYHNAE
jgi:hypothetical protein